MAHDAADAFVFFGATGDLAYRQIFPALQALIRRGLLDMPIIGVARSATGIDALRSRARESLERHGGVDPRAFATLSSRLSLGARVKVPGESMVGDHVELVVRYASGDEMTPYERLLGDGIRGDAMLFVRQDSVEAAWQVVDPVLGDATPVHEYDPGTWGPTEADGSLPLTARGTTRTCPRPPWLRQARDAHSSKESRGGMLMTHFEMRLGLSD